MTESLSPLEVRRGAVAGAVCTTCPYCGVGCGVVASPDGAGGIVVRGDKAHPANLGKLCSKGSALGETLGLDDRLLAPRVLDREVGWSEALDLVAAKFAATIRRHGPDSVAFYVSGQMLTEDYYVANKLMKGFIGSANIDTNSRLCMASSVAGHRRAFGTDTVPGQYEDLELADLVVLTGSNLAWCHPVLYQRLAAAKKARPEMRVVTIDPRVTATTELADLHLAIAPGGDAALFNGLLAQIVAEGAVNAAYVGAHVAGFEAAVAAAEASDLAATGLSRTELEAFFALWIGAEKVVTVYSQGINQSSSGSDKVNAIINCHLATGRIGRPGMGPFSVTGQPNAMGGREVGGLANMLACHLDIENAEHRAAVQGYWGSPTMAEAAGLKAVDMFRAIEAGEIKALWVIHTNPAVSMPDADRVARAIAACPFTVVSDITAATDTARLADVLLPAAGWGEKDGTVTNSERRISRQRPFRKAPGEARPDWWHLAELAKRMGFAGFDWAGPAEIFAEYAGLSGVAGALGRDFDISDHAGISEAGYNALRPFLWPANALKRGGRFFADGAFYTPDRKGRMLPITPRAPQDLAKAYPYRLNTGRVRDQWHTMTRTGLAARLGAHMGEPYLQIHPRDAEALRLRAAGIAEVTSPTGRALLRVLVSEEVLPGHPFAPMHWTGETASLGRVDALVPSLVDPVSGQPESKSAAVAIKPFSAAWYGFAAGVRGFRPESEYWASAPVQNGYRAEMAGAVVPADWEAAARAMLGVPASAECLSYVDAARGQARFAFVEEGKVTGLFFVAPEPVALSREAVIGLLGDPPGAAPLAGRAGTDRPDPGPIVCACFGVGRNTIAAAVASGQCASVPDLGRVLQAGTNCGSCKPELAALIAVLRPQEKEAAE